MEIKFEPRGSGKTHKIKNLILKEMKKEEYNIACISMNQQMSGIFRFMLSQCDDNFLKAYMNPSHSITFSTYKRMHKDLLGQHPRHIFFDDIRMKSLVDILPELNVFEHEYCKIDMFGSVENLITDFRDLYKVIQDQKDVITRKNKEIRIWITRASSLEYQIRELSQMICLLKRERQGMEYSNSLLFFKNQMLEKRITKLERKLRKSSRLRTWWYKTWAKFKIIGDELK